jgi:putative AlgH/UPF0301 family transcriptional regulator
VKTDQKRFAPCHLACWLRDHLGSIAAATVFAVSILMGATVADTESQVANTKSFFLVASRSMPDPVFQQSVILMLPPDEPPLVAGVIINKPTDVTLGNLFKESLQPENRNQKVYFGGPVDLTSPLLVLRTSRPPKAAIQLRNDVYAISDPGLITEVLKSSRYGSDARLFLGRAQWAQEQLRGELLEGAWTVVPVRTDLIFEPDSAKVWPVLSQHEHVREIDAHCWGPGSLFALTMCRSTFAR